MTTLTVANVEAAALSWLSGLNWQMAPKPPTCPGAQSGPLQSRSSGAAPAGLPARLNLSLPDSVLDDALRRLT